MFVLATQRTGRWSAKTCTTDAVLLLWITVAQLCLYAIWRGRGDVAGRRHAGRRGRPAGLTKGPVVLGVMGMTLLALGVLRADRPADVSLPRYAGRGPG